MILKKHRKICGFIKYAFTVCLLCIGLFSCGEDQDNIVGSTAHNIKLELPYVPSLLADGLSTMDIWANILDKDGTPARGMKVIFKSTFGKIEETAFTDDYGNAKSILSSIASETDIITEVTAFVVDTSFNSLGKNVAQNYHLILTPQKEAKVTPSTKLSKSVISSENEAQLEIRFIGVSISATTKDDVLPADGISQTNLSINIFETFSHKPVKAAVLFINASGRNKTASAITDENGLAEIAIKSGEVPGVDTLYVSFGNTLTQSLVLEYILPKLALESTLSEIIADGKSQTQIIATLLSQKNTPIVGANIGFSATDGIVGPTAITDNYGKATVFLVSGKNENPDVKIFAEFLTLKDTINVAFVNSVAQNLEFISLENGPLLRDGISERTISIKATDAEGNPQSNTIINLSALYGILPDSILTDETGLAEFTYKSDAGRIDVTDQLSATVGSKTWTNQLDLHGLFISVTVLPDSLPADGVAESLVKVELKRAGSNIPIVDYLLEFGTNMGNVPHSLKTDQRGQASFLYMAGEAPGTAEISTFCGELSEKVNVYLYKNFSTNITLASTNSFIWVKETGQVEETDITATVLGVNGGPTTGQYAIEFSLTSSPGGGEYLETTSGSMGNVVVAYAINGIAKAYLRSGTKSGHVQVRARLVDLPEVAAQSTKLVIRSGPPYMWIDPSDPNNVVHHSNVLVEPGQHNTSFVNPLREIEVTALFADKYNNPVEQNTAVYFTTSGGSITSDALTNELGKTSVILQNSNPFPVVLSPDVQQLTGFHFPNPNDEVLMLNLALPDYEGSEIINTAGSYGPNDGIATIMAVTSGQDQYGNTINVWATSRVIFSRALYHFTATVDSDSITVGERANIEIRCYDINGNPVASGSELTAFTNAGKITATELMPPAERYGYGSTFFTTQIVNTLNPDEDNTKPASIEIKLKSPNGDATIGLGVVLVVE